MTAPGSTDKAELYADVFLMYLISFSPSTDRYGIQYKHTDGFLHVGRNLGHLVVNTYVQYSPVSIRGGGANWERADSR